MLTPSMYVLISLSSTTEGAWLLMGTTHFYKMLRTKGCWITLVSMLCMICCSNHVATASGPFIEGWKAAWQHFGYVHHPLELEWIVSSVCLGNAVMTIDHHALPSTTNDNHRGDGHAYLSISADESRNPPLFL